MSSPTASATVRCPRIDPVYASSECPPLSSHSLRCSKGVMSSVKIAPDSSQRGRPPAKVPLSTHSLEGFGRHRRAVGPPGGLLHGPVVVRGGPRRDPVDGGGDGRHGGLDPGGQPGVDGLGEIPDDAGGDRSVAGQVVAGYERDRARVGPAAGGQPGDQPAGRGPDGTAQVAAQGLDVRPDRGVVPVESAVGPAQVAGLGHGEGDGSDLRRGDVAEPGVVVGRGVRTGHSADHGVPVAVGRPGDEGVEPVLRGHRLGEPGAAAGEAAVAPLGGVGCVLGVPGLVSAEEVAETQVDQCDRSGRATVAGPTGQGARLRHSLNTSRGRPVTRSTAVSRASSSSMRCSAYRCGCSSSGASEEVTQPGSRRGTGPAIGIASSVGARAECGMTGRTGGDR